MTKHKPLDKEASPGNTAKGEAKSAEYILCSSTVHVRDGISRESIEYRG